MDAFCRRKGDALWVDVHVVPNAARSGVAGEHDGRLKVAVAVPPVDGKANLALIRLFAELSGRPRSAVELVRGAKSRRKTVAISGLGAEAADRFERALRQAVLAPH